MSADIVFVAIGGAIGAPLRYLTGKAVKAVHSGRFPWGTFAANVPASLVLGLITGAALTGSGGRDVTMLVGAGICGAWSTYSTFSHEALELIEGGSTRTAVLYVVGSIAAGLAAAYAGFAITNAFVN